MFVIFGASGNTGSVVAATLLDRGKKVRVVARDASRVAGLAERGAEVVTGDVLDAASVSKALAGAEGAYLLVPPALQSDEVVARGRRIIDHFAGALAGSGVAHAVFLSSTAAQVPSGTGPIVITHHAETALPEAAPKTAFTFVRAAYFMENLLAYAHPMKADGVLPVFGSDGTYPFPMVATKDIGRVSAEALLAPPSSTSIIELSGPKEYSYADAAAEASRILGKTVKATPLPIDALVPALRGAGMSEDMAKLFREMTEAFAGGTAHFEGTHRSLRGTVPLEDVLRPALG